MKNKFFYLPAAMLALGILCLILEYTFYQHVDESGYLHESLFLPTGTFCVLLGSLGIALAVTFNIWGGKRKSG